VERGQLKLRLEKSFDCPKLYYIEQLSLLKNDLFGKEFMTVDHKNL
jgi:hypothetical protein